MKIKPAGHAINNRTQRPVELNTGLAPERLAFVKRSDNKTYYSQDNINNEGLGTPFAYSNTKEVNSNRDSESKMTKFAGAVPNETPKITSTEVEESYSIPKKVTKNGVETTIQENVINKKVYNGKVSTTTQPVPGLRDDNTFRGKTTARESMDEELDNRALTEEEKSESKSRLFSDTKNTQPDNLDSAFGADLAHRYSDLSQIDRTAFAQKKSNIDAAKTDWEIDGNTQDTNDEDKNFGDIAKETLGKVSGSLGISRNTINNLTGFASDTIQLFGGEGAKEKEYTNTLSTSMVALESWKSKRFKSFHTNNWKDRVNLNPDANIANSMASDLRGELGKTTGGIGGAVGNSNPLGQAAGITGDLLSGGASNTNAAMNIAGDLSGKDIADSAWNTQIDELAVLNTTTKDTMYISKPGTRFKAKRGMVQNITPEGQAVFGTSRYIKNGDSYRNTYGTVIDSLRDNQISASRLSNIRRFILNTNNSFGKKQLVYDLKKDQNQGALYNLSSNGDDKYTWNISNELFSGFNLSAEERQLVTLLKNKNTFNKTLGYIYIRPYYSYQTGEKKATDNGLGLFDIPFEFTPRINEGAMQANYQSETLLGRLGQFHIYTGTNLSTLSIELEYLALAPDNIDEEDERTINKQYGTDAWQYYWTNSRIEAIEMKLRSLVIADYVSDNYLIKPPLVEVHLDNSDGMLHTVGDLYKYPAGSGDKEFVGSKYLKYSASLAGNELGSRYKKYIVNSVQIDKLHDADIEYPSLYGRIYNSEYSTRYNPMWHLTTGNNGEVNMGYKGYSRKRGFKATLQLTEVVENFLDLVPDFKAYFDAWSDKEAAADNVSGYAEGVLGVDKTSILRNTVEQTLKEAENMATTTLTTIQDRIDARFDEYEKLSKLYAKSYSEVENKKGGRSKRFYIGQFNEGTDKFAFIEHNSSDNENINRDNSSSASGENVENENIKKTFGTLLTLQIKQNDSKNFKNGYTWNTMVNYSKNGEYVESINDLNEYLVKDEDGENIIPKKLLYKYEEECLLDKENFGKTYTNENFNYFGFIGEEGKTNEEPGYFVNKNNIKKFTSKYNYIDAYTNLEAIGKISEAVQWLDTAAKETAEVANNESAATAISYSFSNEPQEVSLYDPEKVINDQLNIVNDFLEDIKAKVNTVIIAGKKLSDIDLSEYDSGTKKLPSKYKSIKTNIEALKNENTEAKDIISSMDSLFSNKDKVSSFLKVNGDEFTIDGHSFEVIVNNWQKIKYNFKDLGLELDSINNTKIKEVADEQKAKLKEYAEKFDLRKTFAKVHLKAMRKNQLALLGAFNTNKITGVNADKVSISNIIIISEEQEITSADKLFNEEIIDDILATALPSIFIDGNEVTTTYIFKTYQIDMTLITLKDFIVALAKGFDNAKDALKNLVNENKDLIGGLDISELLNVNIEEVVNTYMTTLRDATKNYKKDQNGALIPSDSGEVEESKTSAAKVFLDNVSAALVKSYNAMEKAVVLCDSVFGRKHIEEQLDNLFLEGKDGSVNAVEKYKLSVFRSYGSGDSTEQEARKKNGDENFLSCYKDKSSEYLLKSVEFENRTDFDTDETSDEAGKVKHGLIYRLYAQKQTMSAQATKIKRAASSGAYHQNLMG